ncbi:MAG: F0F1 ATP synthase subunit beta, partial [Planctomycetes bacterium]|nr:F0F1 ATP synthase subunit beta [Planctomycetota bacterium]
MTATNTGSVAQIFGPVVDVRFPTGHLPPIYNALTVSDEAAGISIVLEVAQHLGNDIARCV